MDYFEIFVKGLKSDGTVIKSVIVKEQNRYLPKKKTLDLLDILLSDSVCNKIVVRKLSDYKEGDIF